MVKGVKHSLGKDSEPVTELLLSHSVQVSSVDERILPQASNSLTIFTSCSESTGLLM